MKNKFHSIIYDFFSILLINLAYLPYVETTKLLKISFANTSIILIFLIFNFYKKSSVYKINKKIIIIAITSLLVSSSKIIIFGKLNYFSFIIYQDLILVILLLLPRVFLNLKEINLNFVKNYNS